MPSPTLDITEAQFIARNPSVGDGCKNGLVPGTDCCLDPDTLVLATSSTTKPTSTAKSPNNHHDGPQRVVSGDTCANIVSHYGTFTIDEFYKWNPAVRKDCSSLFLGYYVCIGIPGTPTTSAPSDPTPTQAGITKNCNSYYLVKSGDICQKIVDSHKGKFTLKQL
ncbi:hypothetical protein QBC33DRAFT_570776 [Phialemonium atrogriseum]|uniref:LysM domain-containing protein n=1 Tax=Phialemonium atrogriseum TaxID=1093897 RepID=A0AAJ0C060_9PEZI|nr:uncharacterized protein QBC33DRAFT_570776 [Phialemonium atrogriseum]KAK1766653.1 hypothetical protein QBC33DRAFT_570776 [Phialemonium atrogriseum]